MPDENQTHNQIQERLLAGVRSRVPLKSMTGTASGNCFSMIPVKGQFNVVRINERDPEADGDTVVGGYLPSTDHSASGLFR